MWILLEARQKIRKKTARNLIVGLALVLAVIFGARSCMKKETGVPPPNAFVVTLGNIVSTYSTDGTVKLREAYFLDFPIGGTLMELRKKEGDPVKRGEIIARLDDAYLRIGLDRAAIALAAARANLDAKLASKWQPSDLRVSREQLRSARETLAANVSAGELEVENAQKNFAGIAKDISNAETVAKKDAEHAEKTLESRSLDLKNSEEALKIALAQESLSLQNSNEKAVTEIDILVPVLETCLRDIDILVGVTEANRSLNDGFETYLWAKRPGTELLAENLFRIANGNLSGFASEWNAYRKARDYSGADDKLRMLAEIGNGTSEALKATKNMLEHSIPSSAFPQSAIDAGIASVDSDIGSLSAWIQRLVLANQNIDNSRSSLESKTTNQQNLVSGAKLQAEAAKANLERVRATGRQNLDALKQKRVSLMTDLETAKNRLENNRKLSEAQIAISEANLSLKETSFDPRELAPFETAIGNAEKGLEEAGKRLEDSVLKSPIDGTVGKLATDKIGTIFPLSPGVPFAVVFNGGSLYVESRIEEGDIANVRLAQTVRITFNALDSVSLTGTVTGIRDTSETNAAGIVSYGVDIAFDALHPQVKEGFTAQLGYVLEVKKGVMLVPFAAVFSSGSENMVKDGRWIPKKVIVGIDDGESMEILRGLDVWETISY